MMRADPSGSGTSHLFPNTEVQRATGRGDKDAATSLCGNIDHGGPFVVVAGGEHDLDGICDNCQRAVEGDDGGD